MRAQLITAVVLLVLLAGCGSRDAGREISANSQSTAVIIYVTPTAVPTLVPTVARSLPTATLAEASETSSTAEIDRSISCEEALSQVYAAASDQCLTGPTGYFCNGGLASMLQPESDALSQPGDLAEIVKFDSLETAPLSAYEGGGLVWMRLEENILMDALLVGDVQIRNRVSPGETAAKWRSFTIESGASAADCGTLPALGTLVVQGLYGQGAQLVINGVSAVINGTLIVLTQADFTKFIVIEGQATLIAFGHTVTLNVGQQLNLQYAADDWSRPLQLPGDPVLLDYDLIKHLPTLLFDRALPIPQPGYVQTQGLVNMRAAPDIESRLLYQVPAGETMSVLGSSSDGEWLHIRLGNGETGWMSAELLARNLGQIEQVYDLTPEPPQRYGVFASQAIVNVPAGGNLRTAPDTAFGIKRTLPYGMELKLLARSPYSPWVKVDTGAESGWMALFTLATETVISSLPIDYDVPLPIRPTATPSYSFFSFGGGHAYPDPAGGY